MDRGQKFNLAKSFNILTAMKADKGYAGLHERGGVTSIINCYFNF